MRVIPGRRRAMSARFTVRDLSGRNRSLAGFRRFKGRGGRTRSMSVRFIQRFFKERFTKRTGAFVALGLIVALILASFVLETTAAAHTSQSGVQISKGP